MQTLKCKIQLMIVDFTDANHNSLQQQARFQLSAKYKYTSPEKGR